jgi:hypothetical protein
MEDWQKRIEEKIDRNYGLLLEYQTNPARRPQLELELDSAVLGWMETWNAIHS